MKKLLSIILLFTSYLISAQTFSTYQYPSHDSVMTNPERGFYRYTERSNEQSSLSLTTLQSYRQQGFTLIYRIFYLRDFVNKPISQAYLDKISEDFSHMRVAGIKGIIRFAYTSSDKPPYGDATLAQIQQHIKQLKPLLTDNSDVIMVMQAGFIGAWGEWYYTDHFADPNKPYVVNEEHMAARRELLFNLLDALPADRMIQLRYVGYKMKFFDSIPITLDEAYSGSPKSRIAHHNDCFVSSENDVGSYSNIKFEKNYLEEDTKYTAMGGETCDWYQLRSNCDTSLYEMERFHWTFINEDFYGTTINNWQDGGCYDVMDKRLGYRYALKNANIQDSVHQNGSFSLSFTIKNSGFSNPVNPRNIEIVIRNKATGELFYSPVQYELRARELNQDLKISTLIGIPSYVANGDYEVFLNLPDPKITLKNNPDFSIRLANSKIWNSQLGMNTLQHTLHIHPNASGSNYNGTNLFMANAINPVHPEIKIDGIANDWNLVDWNAPCPDNQYLKQVKLCNNNDTLFCVWMGNNLGPVSRIFFDADYNTSTGLNYSTWLDDDGIDFMVQNNALYKYHGANGNTQQDWEWLSDKILFAGNDSVIEMAIPFQLLSVKALNAVFRLGFENASENDDLKEFVPQASQNMSAFRVLTGLMQSPRVYVTSYAKKAIISFAHNPQNSNALLVVERSLKPESDFATLAVLSASSGVDYFTDTELDAKNTYFYRAYLVNNQLVSPFSDIKSITTSDAPFKYPVIKIDGYNNDWGAIPPAASISDSLADYFLHVYVSRSQLNILIPGNAISHFTVYINSDQDLATGENNMNWDNSGFDYKISRDSLFRYQSNAYHFVTKIDSIVANNQRIELNIPLADLNMSDIQTSIGVAALIQVENQILTMPARSRQSDVERVLPSSNVTHFSVRNSATIPTRLIATWDKCSNCDGYTMIRTEQSTQITKEFDFQSTELQLIDDGLNLNSVYSYSIYSYNFSGKSDDSHFDNISTSVHELTSTESIQVWPKPANEALHIKITPVNVGSVSCQLYSAQGVLILSNTIAVTGAPLEFNLPVGDLARGMYFIHIKANEANHVEKIILY